MTDEVLSGLIPSLRRAGLVGDGPVTFTALTGGVSCDVWRVDRPKGPIVVKRPLPQLRVAAEWHAPVERGRSEVAWLRRAAQVSPSYVPEVLAELDQDHAFAMAFLRDAPVWKDELIAGRVDLEFAAKFGTALAAIHAATAFSPTDEAAFPTDTMFHALRLDPFLLHIARQDPELAPILTLLAEQLAQRKIALVHGDVSPKNILIYRSEPVILDAECAVYGDPAFDLAFCLTHLLLKATWLDDVRIKNAATAMLNAYLAGTEWEATSGIRGRTGLILAALLLARIDGKSPAPYLVDQPNLQQQIRQRARQLLLAPQGIEAMIENWKRDSL